ncbi:MULTISPECIES: glycoside hydrolase family 13 protein [unclassified Clostridium]|uniref:glycoside hydrolase family 13 protein n=1 Tax=unclassified Clostridium TaxID=2614128 RepID=UPI001C8B3D5D|nr:MULTISPECIES: glycoside hydrolase family 13 protein [unclassified Clostridium]MBX9138972.1 glycoside hydrolase family 13 protein [Clostridium sp. K12(2020)]MBX9145782.1 glycoside hydrolase family 13 protein [Clostridium sp. K13]
MNKYAVFHVLDTPYSYGKDKDTLVVRVRVARNDIKECYIYYKDRYDWENEYNKKAMNIVAETEFFTYYQAEISVFRNRYRYYFEFIDSNFEKFQYNERGFINKDFNYNDMNSFQFPYIAEEDLYQEINWLQESVVYQIFPDRFCNGDSSIDIEGTSEWGKGRVHRRSIYGGDIRGIITKLNYLDDLGVNLIYLTPIFKSTTNHKYNTQDYFDIDPQFGTLNEAKELVEKAHNLGMKVVFDAVFNHSGSDFFAFEDLIENQQKSKYKDWYFIDSWPVTKSKNKYYTFANGCDNMPKLNTNNKDVRDYLLSVGEFWIKEVGIDGWRLDVCDEVGHEFWRAFRKRIKSTKKDAIIIGEIMHEANAFLKGDQLDGIMNYPFKNAIIDFFAKGIISGREFLDIMSENRALYMDSITKQMWNLLGSHDTKRIYTECDGNIDRIKLSIAYQFLYIGVPYIYYGDEIGLSGGDDPNNRKCMNWNKNTQNKEIFDFYRDIINIRKENKVFIYGTFEEVYCENNIIAFKRVLNNEETLIIFNNNENESIVRLNLKSKGVNLITKIIEDLLEVRLDKLSFKVYKVLNNNEAYSR